MQHAAVIHAVLVSMATKRKQNVHCLNVVLRAPVLDWNKFKSPEKIIIPILCRGKWDSVVEKTWIPII